MSVTDVALITEQAASASTRNGTARTRSREATHARLKVSATRLFAARGLRNVTTHDIARAAGVATGTFYLHFKDKRSLLRDIVFEALDELRTVLDRAIDSCDGPEGLQRRVESVVAFAEQRREVVRILFSRDTEWSELQSHVLDVFAAQGEAVFRSQQVDGGFRKDVDAAITAQAITGMQARVIDWWTKDPSRASREQIIETLTAIQTTGLYPSCSAGEPLRAPLARETNNA